MKKLFVFLFVYVLLIFVASYSCSAQIWQNFKGIRLVNVADTLDPSVLAVEGSILYSEDDTVFYGRFPSGWYPFGVGGGGGGGLTTADNGLTVNPAGNVQLGGNLIQATALDGQSTWGFNFDNLGQDVIFEFDDGFDLIENRIGLALDINYNSGTTRLLYQPAFVYTTTGSNITSTGGTKQYSFVYGQSIALGSSDVRWSAIFGDVHNITAAFNNSILTSSNFVSANPCAGCAVFSNATNFAGGGTLNTAFVSGNNNDITVTAGTSDGLAMLGGVGNNINGTTLSGTVVIGGTGLTGTSSNTVYVPELHIGSSTTPGGTDRVIVAEGSTTPTRLLLRTASSGNSGTLSSNSDNIFLGGSSSNVTTIKSVSIDNASLTKNLRIWNGAQSATDSFIEIGTQFSAVNSAHFGLTLESVSGEARYSFSSSQVTGPIIKGSNGISTSTFGKPITLTGGNAFAGSGLPGGNTIISTGQGDGAGVSGNVVIQPSGPASTIILSNRLELNDATNTICGVATLVGGTVTVNNSNVTANTIILLTPQNSSGSNGFVGISARSAGVSFTITSSNAGDTSDIGYVLIEPN